MQTETRGVEKESVYGKAKKETIEPPKPIGNLNMCSQNTKEWGCAWRIIETERSSYEPMPISLQESKERKRDRSSQQKTMGREPHSSNPLTRERPSRDRYKEGKGR